ncbi:transmembrane protein [Mycobacterium tuberculosis UT0104]|nr:transmembrane protein [Mycobacterium tuberculosis UT0104]
MSTVHSSIDQHPDLLALRASFDRAAESTIAHFTFGLALLAGLYVAASPWIVGFSATRGLPTCDLGMRTRAAANQG